MEFEKPLINPVCRPCYGGGTCYGETCSYCAGTGYTTNPDTSGLDAAIAELRVSAQTERVRLAKLLRGATDSAEFRLEDTRDRCNGCRILLDALRDLAFEIEASDHVEEETT